MNKNWVGVLAFVLMGLLVGLAGGQAAVTLMTSGWYKLGVFLGVFWYTMACAALIMAEILYREGRR